MVNLQTLIQIVSRTKVNHRQMRLEQLKKLIITTRTREQILILSETELGTNWSNSGLKSPHLLVAINSLRRALMVQELELILNSQYA